jgi:hypothetical protein
MTLTPRQWLYLALIATLLFAGWYWHGIWQDHKEVSGLKEQIKQDGEDAAAYDEAAADKIHTDAAIDKGVDRVLDRNQEAARNAPAYRDYRDRPLPAESVRLYRDAAQAVAEGLGTDRAGEGDDQEN